GDGLGFAKQKDGTWYKMAQSGPAVLEDDVEVQANACVDRATVGETRIGCGSKLDDLVLIGHASQVGANTMLCGQVGLAGSTRVGSNCILAGQVGTAGHLTVGNGAVITAQSGVPNDVPPRSLYSGYPAVENREWLKTMAALNRLPELQKRVLEFLQAAVRAARAFRVNQERLPGLERLSGFLHTSNGRVASTSIDRNKMGRPKSLPHDGPLEERFFQQNHNPARNGAHNRGSVGGTCMIRGKGFPLECGVPFRWRGDPRPPRKESP